MILAYTKRSPLKFEVAGSQTLSHQISIEWALQKDLDTRVNSRTFGNGIWGYNGQNGPIFIPLITMKIGDLIEHGDDWLGKKFQQKI